MTAARNLYFSPLPIGSHVTEHSYGAAFYKRLQHGIHVCMNFFTLLLSYLSIVHYPAYLRLLINFVSRNEKHILFEIIRLCLCIMHSIKHC